MKEEMNNSSITQPYSWLPVLWRYLVGIHVTLLTLGAVTIDSAFAQEQLPRATVPPFANESGSPENDAVAQTTTKDRIPEIGASAATAAKLVQEYSIDSIRHVPGETTSNQTFCIDYQRACERRKPFWHWIVGLIGAEGAGLAVYEQFVEIPRIESSQEDAHAKDQVARDRDSDDSPLHNALEATAIDCSRNGAERSQV